MVLLGCSILDRMFVSPAVKYRLRLWSIHRAVAFKRSLPSLNYLNIVLVTPCGSIKRNLFLLIGGTQQALSLLDLMLYSGFRLFLFSDTAPYPLLRRHGEQYRQAVVVIPG